MWKGFKFVLDRTGARPLLLHRPREHRRRALHALAGARPALGDPSERGETARLLRERWPEACAFVVREGEACRRGEVSVFGEWEGWRKGRRVDIALIGYHRAPIAPH